MFRLLFWLIVLVVVIGPIAFVIAAFEPAPELPPSADPLAEILREGRPRPRSGRTRPASPRP